MRAIYVCLLGFMAFSALAFDGQKAKDNTEEALNGLSYKSLNKEDKGLTKGLSLGQMKDLLKASGFTHIKSRMDKEGIMQFDAKSDGAQFVIQGDECTGKASQQLCEYFEIFAYFKDSQNPYNLDLMNAWNKDQKWTKAYLSDKDEALISQEIQAIYTTAASLLYQLQAWRHSLAEFQYHIGWK